VPNALAESFRQILYGIMLGPLHAVATKGALEEFLPSRLRQFPARP
jgi:hypothetical protein